MNGPPDVRFRLYIAGGAPSSAAAVANLRACLGGETRVVEIIDVVADPARALNDGILSTPMLIRVAARGLAMIVGDLGDRDRLRAFLGLEEAGR